MMFFLVNTRAAFSCLLIVIFLFLAITFSFSQNLWVDEATQLSGISLAWIDIYRWLSGLIANPFLVPADRMPILSYFVGSIWAYLWGSDIVTLRWLSVTCVLLGILTLALYFIRQKKYSVLFPALMFLCLSPNLTIIAVEIRAYALFFMFSTFVAVLYYQIVIAVQHGEDIYKKLLLMLLFMALAINTHFFGLLMSGSVLSSYFLLSCFDKRFKVTPKYFLTIVIALAIASLSILQPVLASFALSSTAIDNGVSILRPAVKLVYRLIAHQSMSEIAIVPWLALLVCYGCLFYSVFKVFSTIKFALVLVLGVGFFIAFIANITLTGFSALAPHYNIWMLPFMAILLGICFHDLPPKHYAALLAILGLLFSSGQYHLLVAGEKYAHTRFNEISRRVDHYRDEGQRVAVIYNRRMAKTWFAGIYQFSKEVAQFGTTGNTYDDLHTRPIEALTTINPSRFDVIIAAYGRDYFSEELTQLQPTVPLSPQSLVYRQFLEASAHWQIIESSSFIAQESADILVYRKAP